MAQIKRKKVSTAAVKGQKKDNNLVKSKKFWIIISSIVAGLILIGVLIWVIIYNVNKSSGNETPDYFGGKSDIAMSNELTKNETVSFTKSSYQGVLMHRDHNGSNEVYQEYIFVFATDLTKFYADDAINKGLSTDDDNYISKSTIETDNKLFNQLLQLQYEINNYNEARKKDGGSEKAALYIVDTSIADNTSIFADTLFGGSEDNSTSILFCMLSENGLEKYYDYNNQDKTSLYSTDKSKIISTCMSSAVNLTKSGFNFTRKGD